MAKTGLRRLPKFFSSPALLILLVAHTSARVCPGPRHRWTCCCLGTSPSWHRSTAAVPFLCREVAFRFDLGFQGLMMLGVARMRCGRKPWSTATGSFRNSGHSPASAPTASCGTQTCSWRSTSPRSTRRSVSAHRSWSLNGSPPVPRDRPWVGRRGLVLASLALAATPVIYGEPGWTRRQAPRATTPGRNPHRPGGETRPAWRGIGPNGGSLGPQRECLSSLFDQRSQAIRSWQAQRERRINLARRRDW